MCRALRLLAALAAAAASPALCAAARTARCFPSDFLFGSATAAYQVEGAVEEGGRSASIWDDFCREKEGVKCANVADDFFHRYKSDIKLMRDMGLQSFRFSVSWSRVMHWDPDARRMEANPEGLAFYHSLIDELRTSHIEPLLTIYHWDLPSELQTQLSPQGWLNGAIVDHFVDFSTLLFNEFGHKVDYWTTFNEPQSFVGFVYGLGMGAPGVQPSPTDTYTVSRNVLVAHARAVQTFRDLKASGGIGKKARIGIVLVANYYYPLDASNPKDVAAAERGLQFEMGWFLLPIVTGDYPAVMRERAGDRLPSFTQEESKLLKGSYDLFMLNHYGSRAATDCDSPTSETPCSSLPVGWVADSGIDPSHLVPGSMQGKADRNGNSYCEQFTGYPPGYLAMIKWIHAKDPSADILLTENGWCGNDEIENMDQLNYFKAFVEQVYLAVVEEKIPVIGYTAWSLLDNYEWGSYGPRFGLFYVNFTSQTGSPDYYEAAPTDLARIPRPSAKWFQKVATTKCLDSSEELRTAPGFGPVLQIAAAVVVVIAAGAAVAAVVVQRRRRAGYEVIRSSD